MNIYTDNRDHYTRVAQLLESNPRSVKVMTYSVGTPTFTVEVDGQQSTKFNLLGAVLALLNSKLESRRIGQARLITNHPSYSLEVTNHFNQLSFRQHSETHAKAWIFELNATGKKLYKTDKIALVGSRNLVSTPWAEITVEIKGHPVNKVEGMFDALWKEGQELSKQQNWFQQSQDISDDELFGLGFGDSDGKDEDIEY